MLRHFCQQTFISEAVQRRTNAIPAGQWTASDDWSGSVVS